MIERATIVRAVLPTMVRDTIGVAGLACIAAGCAMIHAATGVIVAGGEMVAIAWLLARNA